jgi:hypothetical protein
VGALPNTNKTVKEFRAKYEVPEGKTLGFTLTETQCPRCAEMNLQREFTDKELKGLLIVEEDLNFVAQNLKEKGGVKKPKKDAKKKKEKSRDRAIQEVAQEKADDFLNEIKSEDGFAIPHPGTKSVN